jgi:hypothetical protein
MASSQLPTERRGRSPDARTSAATDGAPLLGRYRLRARLGEGGSGTVWAAYDERLERDVAVKILDRERIVGGRFEREARVAARLNHPAIVTLYEAAIDDEGAYLVSELVLGTTLDRLLAAGRLSDRDIVRAGLALGGALAHAHGEGIVHRDVKPSNILVPRRPPAPAYPVKLTDFGVARVLGGDALTRPGDVVGTAAYMAPEQAEGRDAGPAADLYALALVVYEALTGVNPVRAGSASRRPSRLGTYLPPLRRQRRDLPRELGAGLDRALRPRPRERGTVEDLVDALAVSLPRAAQRRGIVAAPWRPSTRAQPPSPPELDGGAIGARDLRAGRGARRALADRRAPDDDDRPAPRELEFADAPAPIVPWPARGCAAAGAALTAGWIAWLGYAPTGIPPAGYGLIAAGAVLALPRAGWLATITGLSALAAASHATAAALVLVPVLLLPAVFLVRRGAAWPVPAGAVALGLLGLGGAWPAVAARVGGSFWRRAALAGAGIAWLAAAGQLAGRDLYLRRPRGAPAPGDWTGSFKVAIDHVVPAVSGTGVLAAALVWALAAGVLPWLARGRSLAVDGAIVAAWSASLVSATAVAVALGGAERTAAGGPAVLGAVVGGAVALAPAMLAARRRTRHEGGIDAQLP